MQLINSIKKNLKALAVEENGQDGIEYLLVIGGISVVLVGAVAALGTGTFMDDLVNGVECAVQTTAGIDLGLTC